MEADENEESHKVGRCVKVATSAFGGKLKRDFRGQCPGGTLSYYFDAYSCRIGAYTRIK